MIVEQNKLQLLHIKGKKCYKLYFERHSLHYSDWGNFARVTTFSVASDSMNLNKNIFQAKKLMWQTLFQIYHILKLSENKLSYDNIFIYLLSFL